MVSQPAAQHQAPKSLFEFPASEDWRVIKHVILAADELNIASLRWNHGRAPGLRAAAVCFPVVKCVCAGEGLKLLRVRFFSNNLLLPGWKVTLGCSFHRCLALLRSRDANVIFCFFSLNGQTSHLTIWAGLSDLQGECWGTTCWWRSGWTSGGVSAWCFLCVWLCLLSLFTVSDVVEGFWVRCLFTSRLFSCFRLPGLIISLPLLETLITFSWCSLTGVASCNPNSSVMLIAELAPP